MLVIMRANRMQEQRDQDNGMHASVSQLATSKQSKEKSVIMISKTVRAAWFRNCSSDVIVSHVYSL